MKFASPREPGLHRLIGKENSSLEVLELYVLNLANRAETLATGEQEASLVCIAGQAKATVGGTVYELAAGDGLYLPRRRQTVIESVGGARLVIAMAAAWEDAAPVFTRFGDAWGEKETHGKYNFTRDVVNLLRRNDKASRLVTGITVGQDGLWTSWPPHHHSDTLEEIYYYFDIPDNGFGIHVGMLMDGRERAEIVRSGDAVIVPDGYHPTVATPGTRIKYVWFLGAKATEADRRAKPIDHPVYA